MTLLTSYNTHTSIYITIYKTTDQIAQREDREHSIREQYLEKNSMWTHTTDESTGKWQR